MNRLAVIVPVKSAGKKSRLSPLLSPPERREFAISLFTELMGTLAKAGLIRSCRVVSSDREVLAAASTLGAVPIPERSDSGVNSAVRLGMRDAPEASEYLVLPSDLPLLRASDLRGLLRLRDGRPGVVISPSAGFDGTNALIFPRVPRFPLSYDRDSFWKHLGGASRLGLRVGVCARERIMFDVDSPDDLRRLAAAGARGGSAEIARGATS